MSVTLSLGTNYFNNVKEHLTKEPVAVSDANDEEIGDVDSDAYRDRNDIPSIHDLIAKNYTNLLSLTNMAFMSMETLQMTSYFLRELLLKMKNKKFGKWI